METSETQLEEVKKEHPGRQSLSTCFVPSKLGSCGKCEGTSTRRQLHHTATAIETAHRNAATSRRSSCHDLLSPMFFCISSRTSDTQSGNAPTRKAAPKIPRFAPHGILGFQISSTSLIALLGKRNERLSGSPTKGCTPSLFSAPVCLPPPLQPPLPSRERSLGIL